MSLLFTPEFKLKVRNERISYFEKMAVYIKQLFEKELLENSVCFFIDILFEITPSIHIFYSSEETFGHLCNWFSNKGIKVSYVYGCDVIQGEYDSDKKIGLRFELLDYDKY